MKPLTAGVLLIAALVFAGCQQDIPHNEPVTVTVSADELSGVFASLPVSNGDPTDLNRVIVNGGEISDWGAVLDAIRDAGKYVHLDLSLCTNTVLEDADGTSGNGLLRSIILPAKLVTLGTGALDGAYITSIVIPPGVTTIDNSAFSDCRILTSINIPAAVTGIGNLGLNTCGSLTAITVDDGNAYYSDRDGVLFNKTQTTILRYPQGRSGSYNIPADVTTIDNYAFSNSKLLTGINIPDSVTIIGGGAFYNCASLTSANIPDGVTIIDSGSFRGCTALTSISIPASVTAIHDYAFYDTALTSISIPDSVTVIHDYAFYDTALTSVPLSRVVTYPGLVTKRFLQAPTLNTPIYSLQPQNSAHTFMTEQTGSGRLMITTGAPLPGQR